MAKLFLRTTRKSGIAKLYTRVQRNGLNMIVCTGVSVNIKEWQKAEKSLTAMSKFENTEEGKKVHEQTQEVLQIIDKLFVDGKILSVKDKTVIDQAIKRVVNAEAIAAEQTMLQMENEAEERQRHSVIRYYDQFYEGIHDGKIRHGYNEKYTAGSVKVWQIFGVYLKEFCDEALLFDDITRQFADDFSSFLEKKSLMPETVNKNVNCFRKLCNLAAEEGLNKNAVSLRVWKERTVAQDDKRTELYLTDEELDALYQMPLSGIREQVRDVFFLGYLSCQRFSDYGSLDRSNFKTVIDDVEVIGLKQQKTKRYVEIPIVDERVHELCQKYDYNFPQLDRRHINRYIKLALKELAKTVPSLAEKHPTLLYLKERQSEEYFKELTRRLKAGETLNVNQLNHYGKLKRYADEHNGSPLWERNAKGEVIRPKYELITSHTARRSGVTNLYKTGLLDTREMMSISGHLSEKVFEKYIKVGTSEQAARIAAKLKNAKKK